MTRHSNIKTQPLSRSTIRTSAKGVGVTRYRTVQLDTIGQLAGVLNHELRNLLGALGTCAQVLRRNPQLSTDDRELLDIMQTGARRLSEVAAQLAIFRGNRPRQLSEFNLHDLIDETLERLRRDERCSAALTFERRFALKAALIEAERVPMGQVIWELCLNAAQAMGDRGTLTVATRAARGKILVSIQDTGPGIGTDMAEKIFDPLFTTKTRAAGLGLAIAKHVVEAHGGTVEARHAPDGGARFTIALPARSRVSKQSTIAAPQRREVRA